ncbi:solute:sodium symporter family transporter [Maribacter dokdonensis]|uniref:solute:sodium symporter family transporter n=1 Tax=Maribacter dokdonensis TaxID=320912 RepID=UPI002AB060A3|nr:solute:sodium symporter family transporter [Maribacter dokdonensis]
MLSIISFLGFTILVAVIAWYKTRKTDEKSADGYFLAGRSLGAITIGGSILLTNLSAEQIVGLNGQSFAQGVLVMAWETLAAIALVFTAIYLLPKYMRAGITTIPEFVEERFDSQTKSILALLFLVAFGIVLLPTILYSGSIAFSTMFDLPELLGTSQSTVIWICVWSIGLIGSVYAIFGGLKAVAVSDLVNAIGLLIGGLLIPVFGLMLIGDGSVSDGFGELWAANPDKFNAKGDIDSFLPFSTLFTGLMIAQMYYWGTNQSILQRVFGAKSLAEGQKGMILAGFVKFLIPIIVVLPGIIAWHIFGTELENPDQAYPALVKKVLPGAFLGFFAAVLFGAILSSFNSLLNSSSTLFGIDLYRQYFSKNASDTQIVRAGKIFGLFLAFISMILAPFIANAPDGLFAYIQESLGSLSVPILAVVTIGMLTKNVPAKAAKIVLTGGVVMYLVSQFVLSPYFIDNAMAEAAANGITNAKELGIIKAQAYPHFLHIMGILFVINVGFLLLMGKMYPNKNTYSPKITDQIDVTPWKHAKLVGLIISVLVLSTYLIF